ncbi:MAG: hypothetical protein ACM32E_29945 [Gemmatimonadota bacterium]
MTGLVISLAGVLAVLAAGIGMAWAGLRAGDRPGDITVSVAMGTAVQPDGYQPVPVPRPGRRCRLTVVAGQAGGRLRVIRLPVPATPAAPPRQRQVFTGRHGTGR